MAPVIQVDSRPKCTYFGAWFFETCDVSTCFYRSMRDQDYETLEADRKVAPLSTHLLQLK